MFQSLAMRFITDFAAKGIHAIALLMIGHGIATSDQATSIEGGALAGLAILVTSVMKIINAKVESKSAANASTASAGKNG